MKTTRLISRAAICAAIITFLWLVPIGAGHEGSAPHVERALAHSHPGYCGTGKLLYERKNSAGYIHIHKVVFHHQDMIGGDLWRFYRHFFYFDGRYSVIDGYWRKCGGIA